MHPGYPASWIVCVSPRWSDTMAEIIRHVLKTVAGALAGEGVKRMLDWMRSGD